MTINGGPSIFSFKKTASLENRKNVFSKKQQRPTFVHIKKTNVLQRWTWVIYTTWQKIMQQKIMKNDDDYQHAFILLFIGSDWMTRNRLSQIRLHLVRIICLSGSLILHIAPQRICPAARSDVRFSSRIEALLWSVRLDCCPKNSFRIDFFVSK